MYNLGLKLKRYFFYLRLALKQIATCGSKKKLIKNAIQAGLQVIFNHEQFNLNDSILAKIRQHALGLHQLLPKNDQFTYSILMPIDNPRPEFFKNALESALAQTAPIMEVIVGFHNKQSDEIYAIYHLLEKQYPNTLRSIQIDTESGTDSSVSMTNVIAHEARGNFLLLVSQEDWIRPDLLFRYEQTQRLLKNPLNTVLFCNEYAIDEKNRFSKQAVFKKPLQPHFPYFFNNSIKNCLLIPRVLWEKCKDVRGNSEEEYQYALLLNLDLAGADFQNVPCLLYGRRKKGRMIQPDTTASMVKVLQEYCVAKNLEWKISPGYLPNTCRATPVLNHIPKIHVIMPYKDLRDLTIKAVQSIQAQKGVETIITAIDNNSKDRSIATDLEAMKVEVLVVNEPFNYSRLNNYAVENTILGKDCELLLFINNDIELESDALEEMCRWIYQESIGMVGGRLHYPNGLLQHGGVFINQNSPAEILEWILPEQKLPLNSLVSTLVPNVVDAIIGACALMKKVDFQKVGGFDAIWYPINYSDTNLAQKLKKIGLLCFYTPYAVGIHYESITRGNSQHLDALEMTRWLDEQLMGSPMSK